MDIAHFLLPVLFFLSVLSVLSVLLVLEAAVWLSGRFRRAQPLSDGSDLSLGRGFIEG
jgi:hypothetical protein